MNSVKNTLVKQNGHNIIAYNITIRSLIDIHMKLSFFIVERRTKHNRLMKYLVNMVVCDVSIERCAKEKVYVYRLIRFVSISWQ